VSDDYVYLPLRNHSHLSTPNEFHSSLRDRLVQEGNGAVNEFGHDQVFTGIGLWKRKLIPEFVG